MALFSATVFVHAFLRPASRETLLFQFSSNNDYICRYFKSATQKTAFLCLTMMINGLIMTALPFMRNFGLLVTARCLQNIALGAYTVADCRLAIHNNSC